jgi:ectoine hydroxylase-related dioxygenase (phytanoyl-CoA dioxygenase family)
MDTATLPAIRADYLRDGFALQPQAVPRALVAAAAEGFAEVVAGRYETGVTPLRYAGRDGGAQALIKIDMSHLSDRRIRAVATHPTVGELAAAVTGASRIQLWASQLLIKPSGGGGASHIGWHQDYHYWRYWTPESELLTVWMAISDVDLDCGPMRFHVGSHLAGYRGIGGFFGEQQSVEPQADAREAAALLPAGGLSVHHRHTVHGSGDNASGRPRLSLALHLRTERSWVMAGATDYFVSHLDDEAHSPVIYQA